MAVSSDPMQREARSDQPERIPLNWQKPPRAARRGARHERPARTQGTDLSCHPCGTKRGERFLTRIARPHGVGPIQPEQSLTLDRRIQDDRERIPAPSSDVTNPAT